MVDVLDFFGMAILSIPHPYYFGNYKDMVSNVNLIKYNYDSDSDILTYTLVKYYSFGGSAIRLYAHTSVRSYQRLFQHKLVYYLVITP